MKRRKYSWWIIISVLLLIVGWWYFLRHTTAHLVADWSGIGAGTPAGIIVDDAILRVSPGTVRAVSWTGTQCWQVTVPAVHTVGWTLTDFQKRGRSIVHSVDGHYLVSASPDGPVLRVFSWRDGVEQGRLALSCSPAGPITGQQTICAEIGTNGDVWLYEAYAPTPIVILVRGNRVIARGRFTPSRRAKPTLSRTMLAADARTLAFYHRYARYTGELEYVGMRVVGTRIIFNRRYTATLTEVDAGAFEYSSNGLVHAAAKYHFDTSGPVKTGGNSLTCFTSPEQRQFACLSGETIVLPHSGQRWSCPTNGFQHNYVESVSDDGRYATCVSYNPPGLLGYGNGMLGVVERPGRLLATLPYRSVVISSGGDYEPAFISKGQEWWMSSTIAPDGRHLLLSGGTRDAGQTRTFLYTW